MSRKSHSSISGFTVMEILVATGLFALLTAVVAVVVMASLKNGQQTSARISRDQLVTQLRTTAYNKKAISISLHKLVDNGAFHDCACGTGPCTNVQQPYLPFTLYGPDGNVEIGSITSPSYFDASGFPCNNPANPQCLIRAATTFFAQCKPDFTSLNQNPPPTCTGPADFVAIFYTVDENPVSAAQHAVHLKPVSGPIYITPTDLGSGGCP